MDVLHDLDEFVADETTLYFREAVAWPLLSSPEEQALGAAIVAGRAATARLSRLASLTGPGKPRYRRRLQNQIKAGRQAEYHLTRANMRLVISIAKRYNHQGMPLLDLIQEGNLGLLRAVEKWDYTRGYKFSTYATWWIRQAVTRAIANQQHIIRVPVHMSGRLRDLERARRGLALELGRDPTPDELTARLGVSRNRVAFLRRIMLHPRSLDEVVGEDEESTFDSFIADENAVDPLDAAIAGGLREALWEALATLPAREARIVELRYGLKGGKIHTLEEVGQRYGLTRVRIRQIEQQALRRLRHPARSRKLRGLL